VKYNVFFWQNAKLVSATVGASCALAATNIVRQMFAGIEIVRAVKVPGDRPTRILRERVGYGS
jgi:hypothetical protein